MRGESNWAVFIRVWLWVSVGLAVFYFATAFILVFLFSIKSGGVTGGAGTALSFAVPFSVLVGLFALIFTPPVMMLINHR